jgi:hypothetical protein
MQAICYTGPKVKKLRCSLLLAPLVLHIPFLSRGQLYVRSDIAQIEHFQELRVAALQVVFGAGFFELCLCLSGSLARLLTCERQGERKRAGQSQPGYPHATSDKSRPICPWPHAYLPALAREIYTRYSNSMRF